MLLDLLDSFNQQFNLGLRGARFIKVIYRGKILKTVGVGMGKIKGKLCGGRTYQLINKLSAYTVQALEISDKLEALAYEVRKMPRGEPQARRYCYEIIPIMDELRERVDNMERYTDASVWPVPTYGQLTYYVD